MSNIQHTQAPWRHQRYQQKLSLIISCGDPAHIVAEAKNEADARRIVACVNALEDFDTEELVQKPIGQIFAEQAFLVGAGADDGAFGFRLEGGACQMLAAMFAGQFASTKATNYLELSFSHESTGPFTVTMQRQQGKTPGELRSEVEAKLDEALGALADISCSNDMTLKLAKTKAKRIYEKLKAEAQS